MPRRSVALVIAAALAMSVMVSASAVIAKVPATDTNITGTWVNVNSSTTSWVQLTISKNLNGTLSIHLYGACVPTACDAGVHVGFAYSKGVGLSNARAFTVIYNSGFSIDTMTGYDYYTSTGAHRLATQYFTRFTDGSNRYDFYHADKFKRP